MSLRIDKHLLNQSFDYYEFEKEDTWASSSYKESITVNNVRIDENQEIVQISSGVSRVVCSAIAFIYVSDTTPLPEFKRRSKVVTKNGSYIINKIIKINEPFADKLWSVELELI